MKKKYSNFNFFLSESIIIKWNKIVLEFRKPQYQQKENTFETLFIKTQSSNRFFNNSQNFWFSYK